MRDLMTVIKALADENRVRILWAVQGRELCVCQIVEMLGLAPSTVSKHLSILHQARLLDSRKDGRWMFYRAADADSPVEAREIAAVETRPLPLAVYHVPRELEYGLTFYRNQLTFNYDWGSVPREEHLLVAPENSQVEIARRIAGRRISYLGHYASRHVDYYWVAAAVANSPH